MKKRLLVATLIAATTLLSNVSTADDAPPIELTMISQHAAQGDAGAQLLYGLAYLEGRYALKPDDRKALYWLRRAAREGQPYAQMLVGNLYAQGKGVDQDPVSAVYWWQKAALADNPQAEFALGKAYLEGQGVGKDPTRAIHWLTQAAEQGEADARYLLGRMYYEGYNVPQDEALGKDWLAQAAAQGHSGAINLLGVAEHIAEYTTMVYQQSAEVLQAKAAAGDPQAEYELGLRYESGAWDVVRNDALALKWLHRAAAHGNRHAMTTLSHIYAGGLLGVTQDAHQAAQWQARAKSPAPLQGSEPAAAAP